MTRKTATGDAAAQVPDKKPARGPTPTAWRIELQGLKSRESMLKTIATTLGFPAHFGGNLDALYDCLTDMPFKPGLAYTVELANLPRAPIGDSVHTVFADAAEFWRDKGVSVAIRRD